MRLYFAASENVKAHLPFIIEAQYPYWLISYLYLAEISKMKVFMDMAKTESTKSVILDSGAFGAWRQKLDIDLETYIKTARKICDILGEKISVINLDVIPGSWGKKPTAKDIQQSASVGWQNYERMLDVIPSVIHIFHQHEEWVWLERLCQNNTGYIGISPANDVSLQSRMVFLDKVFSYLHSNGYMDAPNRLKIHCFGLTASSVLYRYPFYSADSITWLLGWRFGRVVDWSSLGKITTVDANDIRKGNVNPPLMFANFEKSWQDRIGKAIPAHRKLMDMATKLWTKRGIIWDE